MASAMLTLRLHLQLGPEKGLVYLAYGHFEPERHAGRFTAATETDMSTVGATLETMYRILDEGTRNPATDAELRDGRLWIVGAAAIELQSIRYHASAREAIALYNKAIDYYDHYPQRLSEVTAEQVRQVIAKYLQPQQTVIVVVAPADAVKTQLERFGAVEVVPMPN